MYIHTYIYDTYILIYDIYIYISFNVGITTINHAFGNGLHQLSTVMTGGWFMTLLSPHYIYKCMYNVDII